MKILGLHISDKVISEMSQDHYKDILKNKVQIDALEELKSRQPGHQKITLLIVCSPARRKDSWSISDVKV